MTTLEQIQTCRQKFERLDTKRHELDREKTQIVKEAHLCACKLVTNEGLLQELQWEARFDDYGSDPDQFRLELSAYYDAGNRLPEIWKALPQQWRSVELVPEDEFGEGWVTLWVSDETQRAELQFESAVGAISFITEHQLEIDWTSLTSHVKGLETRHKEIEAALQMARGLLGETTQV